MPQKPIATFVQQITENVRLHLKNIYACGELDEGSTSKESLEVRPEPQGVFYDGQLWDARAFADRLVKSARKSLLLVDNFSRMPPRDSSRAAFVVSPLRSAPRSFGKRTLIPVVPSARRLVVLVLRPLRPRAAAIPIRPAPAACRRARGPPDVDFATCRLADLAQVAKSTGRQVAAGRGHSNPTRANPKVKHEFVAQMLLTVFPGFVIHSYLSRKPERNTLHAPPPTPPPFRFRTNASSRPPHPPRRLRPPRKSRRSGGDENLAAFIPLTVPTK